MAVSTTLASESKLELHAPGQLIPSGLLTTRPLPPLPMIVTFSVDTKTNLAPMVFAESIVTSQLPMPEQAPVQPAKCDSCGMARRVTFEPLSHAIEHAGGHSIPGSSLSTSPWL